MQRSNIAFITLMLFALAIAFWLNAKDTQREAFFVAQNGRLNVSDMRATETYRLQGEWEFYPNRLVQTDGLGPHTFLSPEQDWSTVLGSQSGYASYVLRLSHLDPTLIYGLLLEEAGNAHRVFVNDALIMQNGKVAKHALIYEPATYTTKAAFVSDAQGEAHIVIEVANFDGLRGGLLLAPLFGILGAVEFTYELALMIEVFIFSGLVAVAFIFLFLHFIVDDVRSLLMAVLSALVAMRISTSGTHFIYLAFPFFDLSLIWVIRIAYLSVFMMLPVMLLLLGTFDTFKYPVRIRKYLTKASFLIPLIASFSTEGMLATLMQGFQVVLVFAGAYLIYLLYGAYRQRIVVFTHMFAMGGLIITALLFGTYFSNLNKITYFMLYIFILFIGTTVMQRFSLIRSHSEKLETSAKIDPLTGLFNRVHLNALMTNKILLNPTTIYDVIFLDLNNFKEINDDHGHEIGDQVLRIFAKRIRNSCHEADMIFRFGGDEFVIIARFSEAKNIHKLIKRMRDNITETITINHLHLKISVAIGHERYDPKQDDLKAVISNSDQRMYEDKRSYKFE